MTPLIAAILLQEICSRERRKVVPLHIVFRGMELIPSDGRNRQVMVITIRLLLLLLTLALVVGLVILTSSQKWEESDADQLNTTNGSQYMGKPVFRKLRPPPKPCPGGRNW